MDQNQDPKSQIRGTEYATGTAFGGDNSAPYDQGSMATMVKSSGSVKPPRRCWRRTSGVIYAVKWILTTLIVSVIIAIPMMVLTDSIEVNSDTLYGEFTDDYYEQYRNLGWWISSWILASWISACLFHAFAQVFPYIFRFLSKYINPAHRRYWKVFRFMKWPITLLGGTIGSYLSYYFVRLIQIALLSGWTFAVDVYWLTRDR